MKLLSKKYRNLISDYSKANVQTELFVSMGVRINAEVPISMGQRIAKHNMQTGVKLYHRKRHQQAINRWRSALQRLTNDEDRFITLGYMAQAFCDSGDYESMLQYSLQQMEVANARKDDYMKSEAFLNLSKAYERLADYSKAINYGRASLEHPCFDPRTPGYAHLVIALSQLGFSQFQASLDAFEKAMTVASSNSDKMLELQVCIGLGALFTQLRDLSKAIIFLRNAMAILQGVTVDDVNAKYKSAILYHISIVLRIQGFLTDAKEACQEAIHISSENGNRSVYARCITTLSDIFRELGESEAEETFIKSWARYEEAYGIMRRTGDRMGEVIVLGSMAKSASESRCHYIGQCECQAIQLNKKCLEIAKLIGCKYAILKCQIRLQELYRQLADDDSEQVAKKAAVTLIQEMELFCSFCGRTFGLKDQSLQALRCSHIFHQGCLQSYLTEASNPICQKCQTKAILMDGTYPSTRGSSKTSANLFDATKDIREIVSLSVRTTILSKLDDPGPIKRRQITGQKPPPSYNELSHEHIISIDADEIHHAKVQRLSNAKLKKRIPPPPPPRKPCTADGGLPRSPFLDSPTNEIYTSNKIAHSRTSTVTDV